MDPAELFSASSADIDRIVAGVCRRARLERADAEDFASEVRLALIEDDFAVLRSFEGRSSLHTYLSIVIERLFYDRRTRALGRFFASTHAERLGPAAVLIEKLLRRDRRPLEQVIPMVRTAHPELTPEQIEKLADQLPERTSRPRAVPIDDAPADGFVAPERADARALAGEAAAVASRTGALVRETIATLPLEDRMILRMRFGTSMTIADIARATRLPQRPLYRRIESLLQRFRSVLVGAGLDARAVLDSMERATTEMNFGLLDPENGAFHPSDGNERPAGAGEVG